MDRVRQGFEQRHVKKVTTWFVVNGLLVTTVVAVGLGLIIGAVVRKEEPSYDTLKLIGFPGELFLRMLKMMVIPLIIASIVSGSTSLDPKTNGRMSAVIVGYFLLTSFVSAILGVFLVLIIHPGHPDIKESLIVGIKTHDINQLDAFLDVVRNGLPENIIEACLKQSQTYYEEKLPDIVGINKTTFANETTLVRVILNRTGSNTLGLIVFFMVFGAMLSTMGEKGLVIAQYFHCLNKIIMKMVSLIIWVMPIGVASIICQKMASIKVEEVKYLEDLVLYILTVVFGLAIHQFVMLPAIYFIILRKNPFPFFWNTMQALATGFATESSAAALPVTIQNMEENNGCNKYMTKFVLPIGATINMNGTALFVAVATLFMSQIHSHEPTVGEIITIIFMSTAVSVASAATPSAAIFLMAMTLSVLPHVPVDDLSLLLLIDWVLGRCRTVNNIVGDCYAVAIFQHIYRDDLAKIQAREEHLMRHVHPYLKHD